MSPRAPKICSWPAGCPDTAEPGTSRCQAHRKEPWAGSERRGDTHTAAWKKLRAAVLERDHYRCQLALPGCLGVADQCDHIRPRYTFANPTLADVESNCRALCGHCHSKRSAAQGGRAAAGTPKDGSATSGRPARARRAAPPPPPAWEPRPPIRYGGKR